MNKDYSQAIGFEQRSAGFIHVAARIVRLDLGIRKRRRDGKSIAHPFASDATNRHPVLHPWRFAARFPFGRGIAHVHIHYRLSALQSQSGS
jgi:hypothetical protein